MKIKEIKKALLSWKPWGSGGGVEPIGYEARPHEERPYPPAPSAFCGSNAFGLSAPKPVSAEMHRLARIETRLVRLMLHMGLDANGRPVEAAQAAPNPFQFDE